MPLRASTWPQPAEDQPARPHLQAAAPPVVEFRSGQLPLTVRPLPGEWPVSWLTRAAGRFAITPRALLQAIGVIRQTASTGAAVRRALSPDRVRLLGLEGDNAAELAAPHPTATALRRNQTLYRRRTRRIERTGPRYCPACLAADSSYWPKSWLLTTTLVCTRHRLRLVEACPSCHREPFSRRDWLTATEAIYECPHALPADGPGRRVRRRCRADLRTAPAEAATAGDVAAQLLLDTTAATDRPQALVSACDTKVEAVILFGAILDLTENLRTQGEQELAARTRVATALQCTSPTSAITHLGSLEEPAASAGVPNPLAEALRLQTSRHHLSPTRQLELRAARPFLARPVRDGQRPRTAHTLPDHRTPRPTLHELRHAPMPTITTTDGTALPTDVVRLLTARLGRASSWTELATALGVPTDIAHTMGPTLRALQRQGTWRTCLHTLERHLEAISRTG